MIADRECPVCGLRVVDVLWRQRFAEISGLTDITGYAVVCCNACGMVYADDVPTQDALDRYYQDASKYSYPERDGRESSADAERLAMTAQCIADLVPNLHGRVLDIGCANGRLLRELGDRGFTSLHGLDPSPACADAAWRHHRIEVAKGTIFDVPDGAYHLVMLIGVLEHLRDVQRALGKIRDQLAPDGMVYIEVPNLAGFSARANGPYQELSVEHINYFTDTCLRHALGEAGYRVMWGQANYRPQGSGITTATIAMAAVPSAPEFARPDVTARSYMWSYLNESERIDTRLRATIEEDIRTQGGAVIWGVGTLARRYAAAHVLDSPNIVAYTDNNPRYHGRSIGTTPIVTPDQAMELNAKITVLSAAHANEIHADIDRRMNGKRAQ